MTMSFASGMVFWLIRAWHATIRNTCFARQAREFSFAIHPVFYRPTGLFNRAGIGTLQNSTWPAGTWNQSSRRLRVLTHRHLSAQVSPGFLLNEQRARRNQVCSGLCEGCCLATRLLHSSLHNSAFFPPCLLLPSLSTNDLFSWLQR